MQSVHEKNLNVTKVNLIAMMIYSASLIKVPPITI